MQSVVSWKDTEHYHALISVSLLYRLVVSLTAAGLRTQLEQSENCRQFRQLFSRVTFSIRPAASSWQRVKHCSLILVTGAVLSLCFVRPLVPMPTNPGRRALLVGFGGQRMAHLPVAARFAIGPGEVSRSALEVARREFHRPGTCFFCRAFWIRQIDRVHSGGGRVTKRVVRSG